MQIITAILAIAQFFVTYFPKYWDSYKKTKKDTTLKTNVEKRAAASKDFEKKISSKALKDLENTQ